ncbi:MAG: hypothetical protein GDYSWBUE_001533 [Candidatus Fervidibacterota bacterium]
MGHIVGHAENSSGNFPQLLLVTICYAVTGAGYRMSSMNKSQRHKQLSHSPSYERLYC